MIKSALRNSSAPGQGFDGRRLIALGEKQFGGRLQYSPLQRQGVGARRTAAAAGGLSRLSSLHDSLLAPHGSLSARVGVTAALAAIIARPWCVVSTRRIVRSRRVIGARRWVVGRCPRIVGRGRRVIGGRRGVVRGRRSISLAVLVTRRCVRRL